jgi:uncharacterized protein DUF3489
MTTFTIDCDQNITTFDSLKEATAADIAGAEYFGSQEELAQLAASWPSNRLIEIWNSLPGVAPIKKFKDRTTALSRIWKAAQALTPPVAPQGAHGAPKAKGSRKKAASAKKAAPAHKGGKKARPGGKEAREGSKNAEVLELMRRAKGATLAEIMKATGWQAHTVRGFVSGTLIKKQGLKVESFRNDETERTYRVAK